MSAPPDEFFDLDRLRRNFEAEKGPAPRPVHRALQAVKPLGNPLIEAESALRALEEEIALRQPARAAAVEPFLRTLRERFEALPRPPHPPGTDAQAWDAFGEALSQLEDLLEVFCFVPERRR